MKRVQVFFFVDGKKVARGSMDFFSDKEHHAFRDGSNRSIFMRCPGDESGLEIKNKRGRPKNAVKPST